MEDHGWYSVWRCEHRHFSEAILNHTCQEVGLVAPREPIPPDR